VKYDSASSKGTRLVAGWVARLVYSDANNDGIITVNTEILQETHYYPFGLEFQGHYIQQSGFDYRYKYNDRQTRTKSIKRFSRSHWCRWLIRSAIGK
jgi:hypothetical protein